MGQWSCGFGFLPTHLPSQPWGGLSHQSWGFTPFDSINWLIKNKQIRKINTWTYICWQELPKSVCACVFMCLCSHQMCVQVHPQAVQLLSGLRPVFSAVQGLLQPRDEPVQLLYETLGTRESKGQRERESVNSNDYKNKHKHCCPDPAGVTSKQHLQNTKEDR